MTKQKESKKNWQVVGARIPPALRLRLLEKHKNEGEVSKIIHALIDKYLDNKIIVYLDLSKY